MALPLVLSAGMLGYLLYTESQKVEEITSLETNEIGWEFNPYNDHQINTMADVIYSAEVKGNELYQKEKINGLGVRGIPASLIKISPYQPYIELYRSDNLKI